MIPRSLSVVKSENRSFFCLLHLILAGTHGREGGICWSGDTCRWSGPPDAKYTAQHHHSDGPPNSVHQRSSPSTHCYPLRSYLLSVFLNVLFFSWLTPHFIVFFRVLWLKRSSARTLRLDLKCVLERFCLKDLLFAYPCMLYTWVCENEGFLLFRAENSPNCVSWDCGANKKK